MKENAFSENTRHSAQSYQDVTSSEDRRLVDVTASVCSKPVQFFAFQNVCTQSWPAATRLL